MYFFNGTGYRISRFAYIIDDGSKKYRFEFMYKSLLAFWKIQLSIFIIVIFIFKQWTQLRISDELRSNDISASTTDAMGQMQI